MAALLGLAACEGVPFFGGGGADHVYAMAREGDATAQSTLGLIYERGLGVTQNYDEALYWYRQAAEQGDALAEFHIGALYEKGLGVEQDYAEAADWYRRAGEKGNDSAQSALAYLYERGLGVERDFAEAEALYGAAARQWLEEESFPADATFALGRDLPPASAPLALSQPTSGAAPEFGPDEPADAVVEIDLGAIDEATDAEVTEEVFDGPEPIAGSGESFPLSGSVPKLVPAPEEVTLTVATPEAAAPAPPRPAPRPPHRETAHAVPPVILEPLPPVPPVTALPSLSAPEAPVGSAPVVEANARKEPGPVMAESGSVLAVPPPTDDIALETALVDVPGGTALPAGYAVRIATFFTPEAALRAWQELYHAHPALLDSLQHGLQHVAITDSADLVQLNAGPLETAADAEALCVKLRALGQPCQPVGP